jgi:UDP-sugar pyrophosphorylase
LNEVANTCFVLVAGGLGERLGYNGIKIGIPIELVTRKTFLEYYCSFIAAY